MADSPAVEHEKTSLRSWVILSAMAIAFLAWGFMIFFVVGDKGVPLWDFSVIKDIPGESDYSTTSAKGFTGLQTDPLAPALPEQHVNGQPKGYLLPELGQEKR